VSLLDHINEKATYAFLDMVLNKFGTQIEVLIDKGKNSMGSSKNCVEKKIIIIVQLHNTILRKMSCLNGWCRQ
jgi:PHP family Zn ribbon phosphoesterase